MFPKLDLNILKIDQVRAILRTNVDSNLDSSNRDTWVVEVRVIWLISRCTPRACSCRSGWYSRTTFRDNPDNSGIVA